MAELTEAERVSKMVTNIKQAELDRDELIEYIDNQKAELRRVLGDGENTVRVGDDWYKVESYMGKSFNSDHLRKENPEAWDKAAVRKFVVTAASAKEALTPEEYEQGQKPNTKATVRVSLLND